MQVDQLNKTQPKPLYVKKVRYVAIKKLVERAKPLHLPTMETYYPYRGEGPQNKGLANRLKRSARHRKTIEIEQAITHEIHLAKNTVTESINVIGDYNMPVAAMVSIYGSTKTLLNNRRSGVGAYILGEGDAEWVYFVMIWKDVLSIDDGPYTGHEQTKKLLERNRYPVENFTREENGSKVYYLQKASVAERDAVLEAIRITSAEPI